MNAKECKRRTPNQSLFKLLVSTTALVLLTIDVAHAQRGDRSIGVRACYQNNAGNLEAASKCADRALAAAIRELRRGGPIDDEPTYNCSEFDLSNPVAMQYFRVLQRPGYNNHKTVMWPDGSTFQLARRGYNNHGTIYYPNGQVMFKKHNGYDDHNKLYWPNGTTLFLQHTGYNDHGSIFRPDGSSWLIRHRGYRDDLTFTPPTFTDYEAEGIKMLVDITPNGDTVSGKYKYVDGDDYVVVEFDLSGVTRVEECIRQPDRDF